MTMAALETSKKAIEERRTELAIVALLSVLSIDDCRPKYRLPGEWYAGLLLLGNSEGYPGVPIAFLWLHHMLLTGIT